MLTLLLSTGILIRAWLVWLGPLFSSTAVLRKQDGLMTDH